MNRILITGANRGIGLESARAHARDDWRVFACCRNPAQAEELQYLANIHHNLTIHKLDVSKGESVKELAVEIGGYPLDILLNNAGVFGFRNSFGSIDYDEWQQVFAINTMGPMRMAEAFVENLQRGKRKTFIAISTCMSSISDNQSGGAHLYRSSKAALNMVVKGLSIDFAPHGILAALLHPGWVKTEMGGPGAQILPDISVAGMRKVYENLTLADTGKFYSYTGSEIPW